MSTKTGIMDRVSIVQLISKVVPLFTHYFNLKMSKLILKRNRKQKTENRKQILLLLKAHTQYRSARRKATYLTHVFRGHFHLSTTSAKIILLCEKTIG